MKILITENQYNLIKETIHPSEVYSDVNSVRTVCDGKRNIAMVASWGTSDRDWDKIQEMVSDNDLDSKKIPSNRHDGYVIFKHGHEKQADRFIEIVERYGGYASSDATDDETREIGKLLEYNPEEIEKFIQKLKLQNEPI